MILDSTHQAEAAEPQREKQDRRDDEEPVVSNAGAVRGIDVLPDDPRALGADNRAGLVRAHVQAAQRQL